MTSHSVHSKIFSLENPKGLLVYIALLLVLLVVANSFPAISLEISPEIKEQAALELILDADAALVSSVDLWQENTPGETLALSTREINLSNIEDVGQFNIEDVDSELLFLALKELEKEL